MLYLNKYAATAAVADDADDIFLFFLQHSCGRHCLSLSFFFSFLFFLSF